MNDQITKLDPTWEPWAKKILFYCPACDKKMSAADPLLPTSASCIQCKHQFYIERATYPVWKISGFILISLFFSVSNVTYPQFDVGRFIVILIISCSIACPIYQSSKRRFKIPTMQYIAGSLSSIGWIVAIVLGLLYFTIDAKIKKTNNDRSIKLNLQNIKDSNRYR